MNTHPSHVLKFCPFCGSSHFPWDGIKCHICEDCHHKLYTNEVGATIALIKNDKDELLFTVRRSDPAKGMLDLPGGFIDLGETAEDGVRREVKEELNLVVNDLKFFGTFPNTYSFGGLTYFTIDIVFECKVESFAPLKANDDVIDIHFINSKLVNLEDIGLDSPREVIRKYRKK
jgi:mutator protein MutT